MRLPEELLAFNRARIEETLTDSAVFLRPYKVPKAATPTPGASDGRGGSTAGKGASGVKQGFVEDKNSVPCRLTYLPRAAPEAQADGGIQEVTTADLAVANSVPVNDNDRVRVSERATGTVSLWEVTSQMPCTDSMRKTLKVERLGAGSQ